MKNKKKKGKQKKLQRKKVGLVKLSGVVSKGKCKTLWMNWLKHYSRVELKEKVRHQFLIMLSQLSYISLDALSLDLSPLAQQIDLVFSFTP